VEANIKNNIAPQTPFRIEKIFAEVGDHVKAGQLIGCSPPSFYTSREPPPRKSFGHPKRIWKHRLPYTTQLLSPISGVVTARNYDSGDMYSGGNPIYTVEEIRPVKLMVNVSESLFTKVKKGHEVDIRLDVYGDEVFKGKVNLVYPTIDPATRTFPVEIKIANSDERVRPGMFARVTMSFGHMDHVVAPDRSIVKQSGAGDRYIYVCKDGKVSYQKVELGRRMGDKYEIISGVEDGDQVVITGQSRLTNGMEVECHN